MSAALIEQAIQDYMQQHPAFTPPAKSQHPVVLALTREMYGSLVERFGGLIEFWWILLAAARTWFRPDEDSLEAKYFYSRLFGACGLANDTDFEAEFDELWRAYRAWREYGLQ